MLLDDDSPLLGTQDPLGEGDDDGVAALGLEALPAPAPPTGPKEKEEEEAAAPPPRLVEVSFEEGGSLGIEFQELEPPYVIQQVHDGGLANGRGLEPGDLLATAGGQAVDAMEWDDLVDLLTSRPVTLVFSRSPAGVKPSEGGASAAVGALFSSGFGRGVEEKDDAAVNRFVDAAPAAAAVPAAAAAPAAAGSADEVGQHKSDWNLAALDEYGDSSGSSTLTAPPPAAAIGGGGGEAAAATRRRRGGGDRGGGWRRRQRLRAQHAAEVERLGADAQATLRQAELELETSRAAVERLGADLAARDAEVVRLTAALEEIKGLQVELEAVRQLREQEIKGLQVELEAVRQLREQESLAAKGQQDQLRFALDERDRRLQEQMDTVSQKDQEVKSLLRQLAALGDYRGDAQQRPEAVASAAQAEATTFEVMFALQGSLGLEFQQLSAPYVVNKVHDNGVASGLNIAPGDELIAVADSPVNKAPWADLVQRLGSRPVVARFRQAAAVGQVRPEAAQEGGRGFSLSSIGSSLLTGALVPAAREAQQPPQDSSRLQAEVERLGTLLKARDGDVAEVEGRLRQREEALRLLEAGDANAAGIAGLAQEREALAQQLGQLQACFADAEQRAESLRAERDRTTEQCVEEIRQKEEHRQQASALTERCGSLMTQFESLRATCQTLSADAQQKPGLEGQVQELTRMNVQWQQAHQSLSQETAELRQRAEQAQGLQTEVVQLREYQLACERLRDRLLEVEGTLEGAHKEAEQLRTERATDLGTIHRLQAVIEAVQETGDSQAGHLEAELMERSRDTAALRRELEETRRRLEELVACQRTWQEAAEASRALKDENDSLRKDVATISQGRQTLNDVVERCVEKLEKEGRERPHLVDKRMVTQMLAAYLEQRDNPRHREEIMAKMADLLGFTTAEREQVGLAQRRKTLLEQQDEGGDLGNQLLDFLLEESEG